VYYKGIKLISTWNALSLRKLIKNIYDKYTRVYLEIYLITTPFTPSSTGANNTWDQKHILRLSGFNFVNNSNNFIFIAPFNTAHNTSTSFPILENNGFLIDITSDDIITLTSTQLQADGTAHCSNILYPGYNIFFNAYGVPGYERTQLLPNKNNY
jgi:hypothetical protein